MFKRKLLALDFPNPQGFSADDETEFRNLILWIEDQKIRHYKIEDREGLRNITSGDWQQHYTEFLKNLGCPISSGDKNALIDWLLGYAVRLEYGDNVEKYKQAISPNPSITDDETKLINPLDSLDFNSADFKAGVASISSMLQIPPHKSQEVVLQAICLLVKEKLNTSTVEKIQQQGVKPSKTLPIEEVNLGFETSDYLTAEAAKILRVLHIKELRDLQNSVNHAIVTVQALTANPKTDTKLGKVGKGIHKSVT